MNAFYQFEDTEVLTFFAVLVRFSALFAFLPFLGDRVVPGPVKVLGSLAVTVALFPVLVSSGQIDPGAAKVWGASTSSIVTTVAMEILFAVALAYVARVAFDAISFGGHVTGVFMGFASASQVDPLREVQTQVVSQFQMALAMLIFLSLDGHHLMLRAGLDSYRIVGLGEASVTKGVADELIVATARMFRVGLQLSAPMAFSLFVINIVYGVFARAMPQLNVLVLSFAVSAFVGLAVMGLSMNEFGAGVSALFSNFDQYLIESVQGMGGG